MRINLLMNKLFIIGNGFDLQAGFHSNFSDFFFKNEIAKVKKWINSNCSSSIDEVNFISLLLFNTFYRENMYYPDSRGRAIHCEFQESFKKTFGIKKNPKNWMDVEGFIYVLLKSNGIKNLIDCFDRIYKFKNSTDTFCIRYEDCIPSYFRKSLKHTNSISKTFYTFLFEELKRFEKRFIDYLSNELKDNYQYKYRSIELFNSLKTGAEQGIIINFNYTFIETFSSFKDFNIHGSLSKDIIIGVNDDTSLNEEVIPFTKTFRKLISEDNTKILTKPIDEIIIYGHSLGWQDYAYFQSIFDYYDIYNSSILVKLIYSDNFLIINNGYLSSLKEQHRIEMSKKLFELMKAYGKTLNNKDNGQNLIHKMILEGRLKIELNNFE